MKTVYEPDKSVRCILNTYFFFLFRLVFNSEFFEAIYSSQNVQAPPLPPRQAASTTWHSGVGGGPPRTRTPVVGGWRRPAEANVANAYNPRRPTDMSAAGLVSDDYAAATVRDVRLRRDECRRRERRDARVARLNALRVLPSATVGGGGVGERIGDSSPSVRRGRARAYVNTTREYRRHTPGRWKWDARGGRGGRRGVAAAARQREPRGSRAIHTRIVVVSRSSRRRRRGTRRGTLAP